MNKLQIATLVLAKASDGNPVTTTLVVMIFMVMVNIAFYVVEKLFFGGSFVHFLDLILALAGIAYSSYAVYWCAVFNTEKNKAAHGIKENQ